MLEAPLQGWRRLSQFVSLIALNPYFPRLIPGLNEATMGICVPVMNCWSCPAAAFACPVGAVGQLLARGVFPALALGILVMTGALAGRLVCGWVCPFGLLQDLLFAIPTKFKFRTPEQLKWVKYGLLAVMVLAIPLFFGTAGGSDEISGYFYCKWCPAGTVEASIPVNVRMTLQGEKSPADLVLGYLSSVKFWIAFGFVVAFVFYYRPFCKIACPIGGFLGLFNRVSFLDFGKGRGDCLSCHDCMSVCPMIEDVVIKDNPAECIRCYRCAEPSCRAGRDHAVSPAQASAAAADAAQVANQGAAPGNGVEILIVTERCKGCGFCIEFCPKKVLSRSKAFNKKGYYPPEVTDKEACLDCGLCEAICPEFAIYAQGGSKGEAASVADAGLSSEE